MAVGAAADAPCPDRSPAAVAYRRSLVEQARAANARQGYVHDPELEAANEAYIVGDLTSEELDAAIHAMVAAQVAAFKAAEADDEIQPATPGLR